MAVSVCRYSKALVVGFPTECAWIVGLSVQGTIFGFSDPLRSVRFTDMAARNDHCY